MIQMLSIYWTASDMSSRDTFTAEVPQETIRDQEFQDWLLNLDGSQEIKVEAAIEKIKNFGVVTNVKSLKDGLYEIKWKSGLRVYFAVVLSSGKKTLLLMGSGKGKKQQQAINKAREILKNHDVIKESIKKED